MKNKKSLVRITTVPISFEKLLGDQLAFMNIYFDVIAISSNYIELKKVAKINNIDFKYINLTRKVTPILDLISLVKLYFFLRKNKPLIVHTHTPKAGLIGMIAALMAGVPNRLHTVAGLPLMEANGFFKRVLIFTEKITYYSATKIYPNSFGLYNFIIKNRLCHNNKLKVLGNGSSNGININYFNKDNTHFQRINRNTINLKDSDVVFIFVGRLVKDKGINELIEAFRILSKEHSNCKLLMLGSFEYIYSSLSQNLINEIESSFNINLVGFQNDIRPYLNISDCLILPSYREGLPNVLLQAGSMCLPCITTNIIGCNEVIINGYNGLLIEPKNILELYNSMKYIILNPVQRIIMGENSRKYIKNKFEQSFFWNELLKEYNSL